MVALGVAAVPCAIRKEPRIDPLVAQIGDGPPSQVGREQFFLDDAEVRD